MNSIKKMLDFIAINTLRIVFGIVLVVATVIKAMYSFDDSPYFTTTSKLDIVMFLFIFACFVALYKNREWIQRKLDYRICFVLFLVIELLYIFLVPLKPFSDMSAVCQGALNFSRLDWTAMLNDQYWNMFPANIELSIFWGILLIPLPKTMFSLKVLNVLMIYVIVFLTRKIAEEYRVKYYNIVYLLTLFFVPLLLYANHVYYDIPFLLLCTLALYVDKKYENIILTCIILGVAGFFRKNAYIFLIGICMVYILKKWETKKVKEIVIKMFIGISFFLIVSKGPSKVVDAVFAVDDFQSYPFWNQIYIGLNEAEFGFMDNDFSYERDFKDVIERIEAYGGNRVAKILFKKTFWLWSQGTFQAQRYAFGGDAICWEDKFEYETILTKYLMCDDQVLRSICNSFMRAEYLLVFSLLVLSLFMDRNVNEFRLLNYIMIGFFLVLLIFELKSRYIFPLLPIMLLLGGNSVGVIEMYIDVFSSKQAKKSL